MAHARAVRINRSTGGDVAMAIILGLFSLVFLIPVIYVVGNAFKPLNELWAFPPTLLPKHPTFHSFTSLSEAASTMWVPFSRYFFNTIVITVAGVVGQIILGSLAAYAVSLHTYPGSKMTMKLMTFALMFGNAVTGIPQYLIAAKLQLIDTYWIQFLIQVGSPLGLYLMGSFMGQIPISIIEAARVDGANHWQTFYKIVMPQVKPAWLTLMIFQINTLWGSNMTTYVYSEQLKPIGALLASIGSVNSVGRSGDAAAVAVIMATVPVLVFVIVQSNVIETMSTSGLKE